MSTDTVSRSSTATQPVFGRRWQAGWVVAIVVAVVCVDQVSKAWGWRHIDDAFIDNGGGLTLTPSVGSWFEDRIAGAALDVADAVALMKLFLLLTRRRRSVGVLLAASLALAGCVSNLADRLGLHHWTAPGSVRGVIDFVPLAGRSWNVADFAIVLGAVALAALLPMRWLRPARPPIPAREHLVTNPRALAMIVCTLILTAALAVAGTYWYGDILVPIG